MRRAEAQLTAGRDDGERASQVAELLQPRHATLRAGRRRKPQVRNLGVIETKPAVR